MALVFLNRAKALAARTIRAFSSNKKRVIIGIFLALTGVVTLSLSHFFKDRVVDHTKEWYSMDQYSNTGGHLVSRFHNLTVLVNKIGDTKGIAAYKDGKLTEHVYVLDDYKSAFDEKIDLPQLKNGEVVWKMVRPYIYTTYVGIDDGLDKYTFAFHFVSNDFGFLFGLLMSFNVIFFFLSLWMENDVQKQLKENFAANCVGVVHELVAILSLALQIIKSIDRKTFKDPDLLDSFIRSHTIVDVLKRDMLDIVKDGELSKVQSIDINDVIEDYEGADIKDRSHVSIQKRLNSTLKIHGDYAKIFSIVSNLMSNAYKFATGRKIVVVETKNDTKGNVIFSVASTGERIPKRKIKLIFEPFYRLTGITGSGLGLFITNKYAKLHNGNAKVTYEDGFNIFTITIPSPMLPTGDRQLEQQEKKERFIEFDSESRLRIALVDDEISVKSYIRDPLDALEVDYYIDYFPNTDAFRNALSGDQKYDLVFLDRFIEGAIDTLETGFAKEIRERFGYQGYLYLLSNTEPETVPDYYDFSSSKSADLSHLFKPM